jgi:hypothetical protein
MAFKIFWESHSSVWVAFNGTATFGEATAATNAVYNDPRSDDLEFALWDFAAIDDFAVTERDVEEMAASDYAAGLYMKPLKAAFVIADPGLKDLGDQYISHMRKLGSPWQNRLFASLDDARKWIETFR